jgi:hypothetical protein
LESRVAYRSAISSGVKKEAEKFLKLAVCKVSILFWKLTRKDNERKFMVSNEKRLKLAMIYLL